MMKNFFIIFLVICCMKIAVSCSPKYGCPTNGKNVDAGKLASGDPEAEKAARKAKKFRN